jgi:hypothetical protein
MGIFRHENMEMDMSTSSKTRLYKDDRLIFMGDGYKAITIMINNSKNQEPVREKFHAQLTMREKPKFGKGDDIEALRKQALDDHAKNLSTKKKKKSR